MKKAILGAAALAVVPAAHASAALLFYDGFEYTSGQLLAPTNDTTGTPNPGQHNVTYNRDWRYTGAGTANTNPPGIASGSLSTPGLQASAGNSVSFDTTDIGSARVQTNTAVTSGTIYWSGLVRVNALDSTLNAVNGMMLGGFNNATGPGTLPTIVGAVLRIRRDTTVNPDDNHFQIGTGMNSGTGSGAGGANIQWGAASFAEGATVFVVASYEFVAGATNDIARMWINPNPADFAAGTPPTPTVISAPGASIADSSSQINSFNLRNVNTVGTPDVQFDELRVGDTWADVTPVPEPIGLASIAGFGLLALRRRRA